MSMYVSNKINTTHTHTHTHTIFPVDALTLFVCIFFSFLKSEKKISEIMHVDRNQLLGHNW
jgi:hypothetical protein